MERSSLKQTEGRGRYGWFRTREALIVAAEERIDLDIVSKRPIIPGPTVLPLFDFFRCQLLLKWRRIRPATM